jgi:hypothetical protein
MGRSRPWAVAALAGTPLAIIAILAQVARHPDNLFDDWRWYSVGADAFLSSGPLYSADVLVIHTIARPPTFLLPPPMALLAVALSAFDSQTLWGLAMLGCLVLGLVIIWPRMAPLPSLVLVLVLAAWAPMTEAVRYANVNSLIFLSLAVALRWPRVAGVSLGFAIAAKFVPILMLSWLAGCRRWRQCFIAIAVVLGLTAVVAAAKGPGIVVDFALARMSETSPGFPTRWSLTALGFPPIAAYAVAAIVVAAAFRLGSFSIALAATLLAIPALHLHYWIWILVPLLAFQPQWHHWLAKHLTKSLAAGSRSQPEHLTLAHITDRPRTR